MAHIVFGAAMSHSPMMNLLTATDTQVERYKSAVSEVARRLRAAAPDVLVTFGPDHFRTLFYDLMPSFVIGTDRAAGWGDWDTPAGPFEVHSSLANHFVNFALAEGFDPAFSFDLRVDHGMTQPLQLMDLLRMPIVPIMFNCAGPPLPTPTRCYDFGVIIGRAIEAFPQDIRVAIVASGGLSHDPTAPSEENRVHGRTNGFAGSRERERLLIAKTSELKCRINPDWDRMLLQHFIRGDALSLASTLSTNNIEEAAGKGAQEVRTWFALAGALRDRTFEILCYESIDVLITGMGVIST